MSSILKMSQPESLGAMFTPELTEALEQQANAKETQKRGLVVVLFNLLSVYGQDNVSQFPIPNSRAKTHGKSNALLDFMPNAEGKEVSWYNRLFDGSAMGKKLNTEIAALKEQENNLPKLKFQPEMDRLKARKTAEVGVIKNAVKLHKQMEKVNGETSAVVEIIPNDDETGPTRSHKNIFLRDGDDPKKFSIMSTGQFLAIDVDEALDKAGEKGASYSDLIATVGRGANGDRGTKQNINVVNPDQLQDATYAIANYLNILGDTKERNKLLKKLNEAGSDEFILVMDHIVTDFQKFLDLPNVAKRLADLHEAGGMDGLVKARVTA